MKPAGSGTIIEKYYCFVSVVRYFVCHDIFGFDDHAPETPWNKEVPKTDILDW